MNIPHDYVLNELWKHLPYDELLNLCETSSEFNNICLSNKTWVFLLNRDFAITYNGQNAHNMYLLYKGALEILTPYFPIVTQRALVELVATNSQWSNLITVLNIFKNIWEDRYKIFTIQMLRYILDFRDDDGNQIIDKTLQILEGSYDIIRRTYTNYKDILAKLTTNNLELLISFNTIVFVNKQLTVIPYDYELGVELARSAEISSIPKQLDKINKKILKTNNV
jgi:hypothetical protein